ncbi:hypothetical protein evm_006864 [Chilo suppressalis]|nr:hypothetical protein evm_006864 [Chilo suppressalis]
MQSLGPTNLHWACVVDHGPILPLSYTGKLSSSELGDGSSGAAARLISVGHRIYEELASEFYLRDVGFHTIMIAVQVTPSLEDENGVEPSEKENGEATEHSQRETHADVEEESGGDARPCGADARCWSAARTHTTDLLFWGGGGGRRQVLERRQDSHHGPAVLVLERRQDSHHGPAVLKKICGTPPCPLRPALELADVNKATKNQTILLHRHPTRTMRTAGRGGRLTRLRMAALPPVLPDVGALLESGVNLGASQYSVLKCSSGGCTRQLQAILEANLTLV